MDGHQAVLKKLEELRVEMHNNLQEIREDINDLKIFRGKVVILGTAAVVLLTAAGEIARAVMHGN